MTAATHSPYVEFESTFTQPNLRSELIRRSLTAELRRSNIRSVHWRVLLGQLPVPSTGMALSTITESWPARLDAARTEYAATKAKVTVDPRKVSSSSSSNNNVTASKSSNAKAKVATSPFDDSSDEDEAVSEVAADPLSLDVSSPWGQYYQQQKVEKEIDKDLHRMSQAEELFEDKDFLAALRCVLFVWAQTHKIGYRQGMHDLASCFLFYVWNDAHAIAKVGKQDSDGEHAVSPEAREILETVLHPSHVEADAYYLFDLFMSEGHWVDMFDNTPSSGSDMTTLVTHCYQLQTVQLQKHDPALFQHMHSEGVEVCTYGTRWFRLLFLREFPMGQCGTIWDAVFAEYYYRRNETRGREAALHHGLPLHIALAMLLYLRKDFLDMDFPQIVRRLMNYPPVEDTAGFIAKAFECYPSPLAAIVNPTSAPPKPNKLNNAPKLNSNTSPLPSPSSYAPVASSRLVDASSVAHAQQQRALGLRLEGIIDQMSAHWFPSPTSTADDRARYEENYVMAIAELKKVRDILLGDVPDDITAPIPPKVPVQLAPPSLFQR